MSDTLDKIVARKRSHVGGRMAQRPLRMVSRGLSSSLAGRPADI